MGISSRPWAWPDVVAHPDGYATCGVLLNQPETVVVEVNGVEVWRETMTGLFPRFCRMACLSDGTINVACASQFTDGLDYVYLVEEGSHTQIDQVVGLRPVMITEESGDFVLYETITPFVYRRRVVGGATATFTNPFSGGTQAGILDVIATVVSWAESTIAPGTPQIATASNAAVLQYPMTRNTVTVGQAPGLPQTAEGLLALHNSGEVSTLYPFKALYPHIAYNSVVSPGQWIFIADAQGSTVIINSTDTQLLNTPYTSGVPLVPPLGPNGNTVLPPFQHPVIDPRTGGLMTRPWSVWALDMSKLVSAPITSNEIIDLPATPIPPPVPPGAGVTETYLTASSETATLPNSRELIAGTDVTFDDTTPGERTINVSAAGGITELTGDVTAGPGSGAQAATIANDAVTNAKLADVATTTFKGRITAGTGSPEDLTATQATSMLNVMVGDSGAGGTKGLAPAPAAGDAAAEKFLKADGTYQVPSGTGPGGANAIDTTAFGAEPGSPTAGDVDLYTNSYYASRYSGSAWVPWGPIFAFEQPVDGDFAWVNQGASTVDTTNGGIALTPESVNGSNSVRARVQTAPATPYTITSAFVGMAVNPGANATQWGLCWRESGTGELITVGIQLINTGVVRVVSYDWASPTDGAPSANFEFVGSSHMPTSWIRLTDNGTNRISQISADGQHWLTLLTEGRTTFLTADEVGFFAYQSSTAVPDPVATLLSWAQT